MLQLIARVDQQPFPASYTSDGVTREGVLTPSLLQSGVLSMLYDRSRGWPVLADALTEAVQQGEAPSLLSIADRYLGRHPDGSWSPLVEANAVINCVDRPTRKAPSTAPSSPTSTVSRPNCPRGAARGEPPPAWACPSRRRVTPSAR